ncbi:peptidyl-prolyl cis-trans isomerase-like 2 [Endogone sp. FLAS-F59071]|nr:peptidyl-prolyl cis-trans isomerase-like 2 [Endogone sp. FLAS-F59071]|eukprot:RUS16589.1 peptidyl-prolyl cis-trans isomerase-like 2 [Endogone sp. FLAS-F59071]
MGKWTDKLYITHSEWSGEVGQHSASAGIFSRRTNGGRAFQRLPYYCCSLSLTPFEHPVCTPEGHVFDLVNIVPYIKKYGTNPVTGQKLDAKSLVRLNFYKNGDGDYACPVTFKVFSDHTAIAAIRTSGNVYAYDTVEKLNIKEKNWRDLMTDETFTRKDIIMVQDPHNLENRNLADFHYLKNDLKVVDEDHLIYFSIVKDEERARKDPLNNINAVGTTSRVLAELLSKDTSISSSPSPSSPSKNSSTKKTAAVTATSSTPSAPSSTKKPYNAANYSTGRASASLTSTAVAPYVGADVALVDEDEFMYGEVKEKGYARITTNLGNINVELWCDKAPRTCHNFVLLAKQGYYKGVGFHRSIKNFMIQGGDPTGTGKGGESYWKKPFPDEFKFNLTHNARGLLSMANHGKNTNGSQFFITYRPCVHLDRKHTIFGKVVGGLDVLDRMEQTPTDPDTDRPETAIVIKDVTVFVDPYEQYRENLAKRLTRESEEGRAGRREMEKKRKERDEKMTWFGPAVGKEKAGGGEVESVGIGKYLKEGTKRGRKGEGEKEGEEDEGKEKGEVPADVVPAEYVAKKRKVQAGEGGFGNFDSW